jgi:hypothetical protein
MISIARYTDSSGANLVRRALLGALSPSRVIPSKAGTQVYRCERLHATLGLGPRFRRDDGSFVRPLYGWLV